jgi:hypothetical protein
MELTSVLVTLRLTSILSAHLTLRRGMAAVVVDIPAAAEVIVLAVVAVIIHRHTVHHGMAGAAILLIIVPDREMSYLLNEIMIHRYKGN